VAQAADAGAKTGGAYLSTQATTSAAVEWRATASQRTVEKFQGLRSPRMSRELHGANIDKETALSEKGE